MRVVVNPNSLEIRRPKSEGRSPNKTPVGERRLALDFGLRASNSSGVALVITLIMLAVITFMAIAFLVLSRGERSSVGTATDQSLARLAADNALERVQAELVAPMIVSGNASSFGLMVSTNYISQIGFQGGNAFPAI